MAWRQISYGLAGQHSVEAEGVRHTLIKRDVKIQGSDLPGYVYQNTKHPNRHIIVASNGMFMPWTKK